MAESTVNASVSITSETKPIPDAIPDTSSGLEDTSPKSTEAGAELHAPRSIWYWLSIPFRKFGAVRRSATPVTTRLTREGWQFSFMIGFVILGAVVRNVNLLVILAGTMLAFLIIQWRVCSRTIYGVSVRRRLPRTMQARKPFEVELILTNPKRFLGAWWVLVDDRLTSENQQSIVRGVAQSIGILFQSLPPKSTRIQRYQCQVPRRGVYQFLGSEVTTRFPLGLMRGILPPTGTGTVIVQPAIGKLLPGWTELFDHKRSGAKQRKARSLSDDGEFFGLRAYRAGDSPRSIHWRSSARFDELMVKQFQRADSRELVVVLDLFQGDPNKNGKNAELEKFEDLAVEFVASIANYAASSNQGVISVAIADADPTLAFRVQTRTQTHSLMDRLGTAKIGKRDGLPKALGFLERELRHVDRLIVVSTRPEVLSTTGLATTDGCVVFWRSCVWLDVSSGALDRYFTPAS